MRWYIKIKKNSAICGMLDSILWYKFISGVSNGPILDRLSEKDHIMKTINELLDIVLKRK